MNVTKCFDGAQGAGLLQAHRELLLSEARVFDGRGTLPYCTLCCIAASSEGWQGRTMNVNKCFDGAEGAWLLQAHCEFLLSEAAVLDG